MVKTSSKNRKRLVLLDSHAILHRAYHAMPDFSSSGGEPTGALYGLAAMLMKIINDLKPDYIAACYDLPGPTFRHEAYKEYKGTRQKTDDELVRQINRSRDVFKAFNIPIYEHPGFEADDMLGTISEQTKKNLDVIIASGDMDTLQLVDDERVRVFTLKKGIQDTVLYDEKAVEERFGFKPGLLPDYKGLRGDPSDNIIGIKGIGEKTAEELIQKFGTIENLYKTLKKNKKALEKAGIKERIIELLKENEEEAEFSKMLALIRRDAPVVYEVPKKEWNEDLNPNNILNLFQELEFRSLRTRAESMFKKSNVGQNSLLSGMGIVEEPEKPMFTDDELKELRVMLWLVNSSIGDADADEILRYTKTKTSDEAREVLLAEIKKQKLEVVWNAIEKPLMPIVKEMERRGIRVDVEYLKKLSLEYHKELSKIEKKIYTHAGQEFNINSPKQLSEIIFEKLGLEIKNHKKTGGGAKSTRESELEKMKELHPIIGEILSYRVLQKLLSTYIDNIPKMVGDDGRLHAKFIQTGAATGRMSSADPNLQNIPNKSELGRKIRNAFTAETGYVLAAFDYSQIELRVAAFLSGDEKLIKIFREGEDVHTEVASYVFKVKPEEVTKEMRRQAKVINFGILYGMGVNALRENLGSDRATAQKFYNEYFETFTTLAAYLDKVKADAARVGYTTTFYGRRRHFGDLRSKIPYIRAAAERMAINAPIQGTEADVIKLAMVQIESYIKKEGLEDDARLLLQVHDELVYEIKKESVEKLSEEIKKIMEAVLPPKEIKGVVLTANTSTGKNWGEME